MPSISTDSYISNYADIIAVMLIMYSNSRDASFTFSESQQQEIWERYINENFLENPYISPPGIAGILSILKETFQVLSLEQTPQ